MYPIAELLEEKGDEIFSQCPSVVLEVGLDKEIIKGTLTLAKKHNVKTFALVANMSIAAERRDLLQQFDCVICNQQEAGILFLDDYEDKTPEEMRDILAERIVAANIPAMVVTMGADGAVYANLQGEQGICAARKVQVKDTTGAGDSFCAGVAIGITYGKTMAESVEIGTTLAASVITSSENVCPRFRPEEFDIQVNR
jgi:pseudouridine kinase